MDSTQTGVIRPYFLLIALFAIGSSVQRSLWPLKGKPWNCPVFSLPSQSSADEAFTARLFAISHFQPLHFQTTTTLLTSNCPLVFLGVSNKRLRDVQGGPPKWHSFCTPHFKCVATLPCEMSLS